MTSCLNFVFQLSRIATQKFHLSATASLNADGWCQSSIARTRCDQTSNRIVKNSSVCPTRTRRSKQDERVPSAAMRLAQRSRASARLSAAMSEFNNPALSIEASRALRSMLRKTFAASANFDCLTRNCASGSRALASLPATASMASTLPREARHTKSSVTGRKCKSASTTMRNSSTEAASFPCLKSTFASRQWTSLSLGASAIARPERVFGRRAVALRFFDRSQRQLIAIIERRKTDCAVRELFGARQIAV